MKLWKTIMKSRPWLVIYKKIRTKGIRRLGLTATFKKNEKDYEPKWKALTNKGYMGLYSYILLIE